MCQQFTLEENRNFILLHILEYQVKYFTRISVRLISQKELLCLG